MGRWDFLPFVRYKKSSKRRSLHPDALRGVTPGTQADPLDKEHAASVATNGNNPTPRLVSSFLKLPEDVLIEILCHSLTPRDIIAVSHTCRILRLCASSLIVWECAWGRDDSLPALNPPNIIPIHATSVYSEEDGTELTLEQPLPSLTFGPPSLQQLGFSLPPPHKALDPMWGTWSQGWNRHQKIYWSMMRVRHQLAHSEPVVAPVHRLLHQHPIMDFIDMRLTPNGEVLVTYLAHEVRLMHLEMGKMLVLPIRIETSFNGPYSVPVVCGIFTHKGKDGVLFAAPFSQKNQVNVFFQPFDSFRDNESLARQECPPAFTNVDLPVEWTVSHLSLVGQFLIVGDIIEGASWWTYRVANLTTRHIYILSSLKGAYHLEVVESKWIVLFHSSNDISVYALPQWEIPVERSVPAVETTLFPLQKGVVDTHDPHTTVVIPSVYFKGESDPYPAGIIYFTLKIGPSITATTDNGALVRDATWMEGNPRVSASLSSPVAVSNPRPANGARRVMASLLRTKPKSPRMVEPSVGHVQSSGTYVLSALTPVNDLPAPLIFASLSKNAHGVPLILKKPLMVRNSNPHGQEVVAPLGCNPGAQWMDFDWNEPSGRLVLINSNQHHCEIMLYQF